jgi:CheY-like chemotaxis protein
MSKRILLIESDLRFASEVKAGFENLDVDVDVVGEGPGGLERATATMPDLILLTIELPGMNGFLVCKKIKKSSGIDKIPLIILSSEASEETFDQHRKLKTHADDYIHKPVTFEELLDHVRHHLPLGPEEVEFEDEAFELKGDEIILEDESVPPPVAGDSATPSVEMVRSSEPALTVEPFRSSDKLISLEPVLELDSSSPPPPPIDGGRGVAEISSVPPPLPKTEAAAQEEETRDDIEALYQELENVRHQLATTEKALREAKAAAKARESGISGREFLDLRERLNRKERELLEIRDQISARDKHLVEANDNLLKVARELEDTKDHAQALERELENSKAQIETLTADKEIAKKRGDDLKGRLDKTDSKLKAKEEELGQLEVTRVKENEEIRNQMAQRLVEEAQARQSALEELRSSLQSDAAEKAKEAEARYQNDLQALREQLEGRFATETLERDQEHLKEMARVNRNLFEVETKLAALEEKETSLKESLDGVTADRDAKVSELATAQAHVGELEVAKREHEERLAMLEERAKSLESSLEQANQKLDGDRQLLERIREALASSMGQIEQRIHS